MKLLAAFADMAITTFDVDPAALARQLPPDLPPDVYPLRTHGERAFVSAVSFRASRVRLRALPWPHLAYPQVNYRAYVRGPEGRAVWFFRMFLGSRTLAAWQAARGLPLEAAPIEVDAAWDGPRLREYHLVQGGTAPASMTATGGDPKDLDGFVSEAEALDVLTHPLVGYSQTGRGRRLRYEVGHARLDVARAEASCARYALLEERGLVAAGARPHSILVARRAEFEMELPRPV